MPTPPQKIDDGGPVFHEFAPGCPATSESRCTRLEHHAGRLAQNVERLSQNLLDLIEVVRLQNVAIDTMIQRIDMIDAELNKDRSDG